MAVSIQGLVGMMKFHMGMNLLAIGLAVWSIGLSTQASADDDENRIGLRPSYGMCLNHSEGITANMMDCNGSEQDYQSQRYNNVYYKLLNKFSDNKKKYVKEKEKYWIKERKKNVYQIKNQELQVL